MFVFDVSMWCFWTLTGDNRDFRPQIRIQREKLCFLTISQVCRVEVDPQNSEKKIYMFMNSVQVSPKGLQDLQDNSQDLQDHLQDIPHLLVHLSGVVLDPQTPKNHPDVPTRTL